MLHFGRIFKNVDYVGTTFEKTTLANSVLSLMIKTSNEPFVGFQLFFIHGFYPPVLENKVITFTLYGKESCNQNHSLGMKTRFFANGKYLKLFLEISFKPKPESSKCNT